MKTRISIIVITTVMLISLLFIGSVSALFPTLPTPPTATVSIQFTQNMPVTYDVAVTLSGITTPADVKNGLYVGYCIDTSSLGIPFGTVNLYSSLAALLPSPFNSMPWGKINYILNDASAHSATSGDIQMAIWSVLGQWSGPTTPIAGQLLSDAAGQSGFTPGTNDCVAVILDPVTEKDNSGQSLQNIIIKVCPQPKAPGLTPGFWKNNLAVYLGITPNNRQGYSNPTGSPTVTKDNMGAFFLSLDNRFGGQYDLNQLYRNLCPQLDGITAEIRNIAANTFNVAAGLAKGPPWN